jgi:hypothetical protein
MSQQKIKKRHTLNMPGEGEQSNDPAVRRAPDEGSPTAPDMSTGQGLGGPPGKKPQFAGARDDTLALSMATYDVPSHPGELAPPS